jgi:hypothetical protein
VRRVQRRALERALVGDVDARRYFALAGSLDRYGGSSVSLDTSATAAAGSDGPDHDGDSAPDSNFDDAEGVLPAVMASLALVPYLDESSDGPASPLPSGPQTNAPSLDPWEPTGNTTRPAVRRGARLALRWFDVPPERVAARAGLPEVVLTTRRE